MGAREYFERLMDDGAEIESRKLRAHEMRAQLGSHSQQYGSVGGGGGYDAARALTNVIAYEVELERDVARHKIELEEATRILYGRSGRGGLAKARNSTDADIICCHYLQLMKWPDIAENIVKPESASPGDWCRMRAMRAFKFIDRTGMNILADS